MAKYRLVRIRHDNDPEEKKIFRFAALGKGKEVLGELELFFEDALAMIPYIFVPKEMRRQGVGSFLLQTVVDELDDSELFTPLEIRFVQEQESEELYKFFMAQGNFDLEPTGSSYFTVSPAQRKKLSKWQQLSRTESSAEEFFSLTEEERRDFYDRLQEEDDLGGPLEREEEDYDKRLCFASLSGDQIMAAVFMQPVSEDVLDVSFLYARQGHPTALRDVLCAAINAVDELYSNATLQYTIITPEGLGIMRGIFGDGLEEKPVMVARWDGLSNAGMQELGELMAKSFA
ncbi:MAG: hypothetical protein IK115_09770 [Lachnospiraceae bacterium]|nr:hypothetical protein [Lachnospiraceae bacterium]